MRNEQSTPDTDATGTAVTRYLPETLYVGGTPLSYLDVGSGPTVVLFHSGGGSSLQWRPLMERLAPHYRVIAPDMPGHGNTPYRETPEQHRLAAIVELYSALIERVEGPLHLVGHSMGATYALELAASWQDRLRSLTLFEPSAFALLRDAGEAEALAEIQDVAARHVAHVDADDLEACAEVFMGYWIGLDAWRAMPRKKQETVMRTLPAIAHGWVDIHDARYTPERYRGLRVPTLLMRGSHSTRAARTVMQVLHRTLPNNQLVEIANAGHMAPVTHPDVVNSAIVAHLVRHTANVWRDPAGDRDVA